MNDRSGDQSVGSPPPPSRGRNATPPGRSVGTEAALSLAAVAPGLWEDEPPIPVTQRQALAPTTKILPKKANSTDLWGDIEDTMLDNIGTAEPSGVEPFFDGDPGFNPDASDNGPDDLVDFGTTPASAPHNKDEKRDALPPSRFVRGFQKNVRLPVTLEESLFEFDIGDRALQHIGYPELCANPGDAATLLNHFEEWLFDAQHYDPVAARACHTTLNARAIELLGLHLRNLRNCYDPDSEIANIILVRVASPFCDAIRQLRSIGEQDDAEKALADYRQTLTDVMYAGKRVLDIIVNPELYEDWRATIDAKARDNADSTAHAVSAKQRPTQKPVNQGQKSDPAPSLFDFKEPLSSPMFTVEEKLSIEPLSGDIAEIEPPAMLPPEEATGWTDPAPTLITPEIANPGDGVPPPATSTTRSVVKAQTATSSVVDLFGEVRDTRRRPR